ncbi:MAG: [Fe-Fe] hydrogenase large subunit C-terminal domain-containing protein [Bacteroidales bacterium]|jgi:nitrogen-specific signal transduction histidine kinase/iron only hydrogenase large subunit-like protein|nr:[Fe-Fe] hydrogenase large subunit C-terminal domain-containing protein [Bacteroidales bacterium]
MAHNKHHKQLVFTVKDRCRVCFTCVRECPVKAIKIINGQAEVISERCIGCGNCVRVCRQEAKVYLQQIDEVKELLKGDKPSVACIAPSFPAEFTEIEDYRILVGMVKKLGFEMVTEVAFGADMVAVAYKNLYRQNNSKGIISSDCPAIVYYVEHYLPELVDNLAKLVSPMVAQSRFLKKKYGEELQVVFIGPCIAKKAESDEIDYALTFTELRDLLQQQQIKADVALARDFDPPYAGKGAIFPVSHGLLQNMDIKADITKGDVLVAEGRINVKEALNEFSQGSLKARHLELLCCEGCIMGPGMSEEGKKYLRRSCISNYVAQKFENFDQQQWEADMTLAETVDLSTSFKQMDRRTNIPSSAAIAEVLKSMGKNEPSDYLDCGACGYDTCVEHSIAIVQGLAETEMCLPYTIEKLHQSIEKVNLSNQELATAREALKQSEKLAHMGQLSAGIAHELNNPLGVITMYSNLLLDDVTDDTKRSDLQLIVEQTERCRKIVGGLLNFARKNQVRLQETNLEQFVDRSIKSIIRPKNIKVELNVNMTDPYVFLDCDQVMQMLTNLEKNAVEAMPNGGTLTITLSEKNEDVIIAISDSGIGISKENKEKLFTPFFTTKEVGKGTGLGLPLCYGIVKMHKGKIDVKSNTDPENGPTGTTFTIRLPRNPQ